MDHLFIGVMVDGAHQLQSVDNHYDYYAYVFGKCKQEFPEIVTLYSSLFAVERRHFQQSAYELGDVIAPLVDKLFFRYELAFAEVIQQYGDYHVAVGAYLLAE